jgi:MraZ protein
VSLTGLTMLALDAKGRLSIPTRYRAEIEQGCQGNMVFTVHHRGKSLLLYPKHHFQEAERKVNRLSDFDPNEYRIKYLFNSHAMEVEMDGSGRVLVPPVLRDLVGIDKRVALTGQSNKFEIWNEDIWQQERDRFFIKDGETGVSEKLKDLHL